ncbi:MAG: hypothetical protein ACREED_02540, partial [Stellaceae bacterium]
MKTLDQRDEIHVGGLHSGLGLSVAWVFTNRWAEFMALQVNTSFKRNITQHRGETYQSLKCHRIR